MSVAELNLQSGLWQMLTIHERDWPVHDLMASCVPLVDDEELASYLKPGAEARFRRFVRQRPGYFHYDSERDSVGVAKDSPNAAAEGWLAKYLALRISEGCNEVGAEASDRCQSALPTCMTAHLNTIYGGSWALFCKTHSSDFVLGESGLALLTMGYHERSIASYIREEGLVSFFIDLLHKIGATEGQPCNVHMLTKYLYFMGSGERKLLHENYRDNLNVFFLLNPANFATTRVERGSVFLKNHDPHYAAALFIRQQLQIQCASAVSLEELALRAKYSSLPVAQLFFGVDTAVRKVREIVLRYPSLFHMDEKGEKVRLRDEYPPDARWNADTELLAVAYFIDILKGIDATSPSRAICFNYIVCAANAAPQSCKNYLDILYPGLEVIGLFHLHPGIFDLSSVNRVSLIQTTEAPETTTAEQCSEHLIEKQAVEYAAALIKHVRHLTPDLFGCCLESLSRNVREYCRAPVKGRLQSIIESGRAALAAHSLRTGITATAQASTQTAMEPTSLPSIPAKEATEKRKPTHLSSQKAEVEKQIENRAAAAAAVRRESAAEPYVSEAQSDIVLITKANNRASATSLVNANNAVQSNAQKAQNCGVVGAKAATQAVATPLRKTGAAQPSSKKCEVRVAINSKKETASASFGKASPSVHEALTNVILGKNGKRKARKRAAVVLPSKVDATHPNDPKAEVKTVAVEQAAAASVGEARAACVNGRHPGSLVNSPSGETNPAAGATKECAQTALSIGTDPPGGGSEDKLWAVLERLATLSPSDLKREAKKSPSKNADQLSAREATKITVEVTRMTICKVDCP